MRSSCRLRDLCLKRELKDENECKNELFRGD